MGGCLSCCGGSSGPDKQLYESATRNRPADTEADRGARAAAAEAAAARQQKFESSAGGRAAMKAVREVQQERKAPTAAAGGKDTAADWLS